VAARLIARLPPRTLVTAASILLVVGGVAVVDVSSLSQTVAPYARSASSRAASLVGAAAHAVRASLRAVTPSVGSTTAPAAATAAGAPAPAQAAAAEPESTTAGLLAVFSRVPLDVYVADRRIGSSEAQIVLAPGRYRVGLVNSTFNYRGEISLRIRPGEVTSHTVTLPDGRLQVHTEPGAEVWIEGERAGVSPLGPISVPIGTREVLVRHPELGERREGVEVRYGEITEVRVTPGRPAAPSGNPYPLPSLARSGPEIRGSSGRSVR
jgi:hypothetical protein